MTAAELLPALQSAGVVLFVTEQGTLRYRGDQAAVEQWLPEIRAHKAELIACLTTAANDEPARHPTWLVTLPTGERFSSMFCPPLSLAEVQARYPGAQIEREQDLEAGQQFIDACARDLEQLRGLYAGWPDDQATEPDSGIEATAKAVCSRCRHWTPDRINPAGGLGRCAIEAPASKRIGALWPGDGVIHCNRFEDSRS